MTIRKSLPAFLVALSLVFVLSCKTAPEPASEPAPDAETAASEPWEG